MVGMQRNQTPIEVPDDRTPYQRRTESPAEPGLCLLEINDHIRRAMEEIDEFLRNKPRDTQAFLPLALGREFPNSTIPSSNLTLICTQSWPLG